MRLEEETEEIAPQVSQPQGAPVYVRTHYNGDPGKLGIDGVDSDLVVDTFEVQPGDA